MSAVEGIRLAIQAAIEQNQAEIRTLRAALSALDTVGQEPAHELETAFAGLSAMRQAAEANGIVADEAPDGTTLPLTRAHSSNGNGKAALSGMTTDQVVLAIAAEHRGQGVDSRTLAKEALRRGWTTQSADPPAVIAASLVKLRNKGTLHRPESGVYVLP